MEKILQHKIYIEDCSKAIQIKKESKKLAIVL